jgi:hypothetical protein
MSALRLAVEALALYAGLPLLFDRLLTRGYRRVLFPALWVMATLSMLVLRADPSFDGSRLWSLRVEPSFARVLVARTVLGIGVVAVLSRRLAPDTWLALPRTRPWLWLLLATLYPVLSVLPQGVFWRVFFVHRYEPLLGHGVAMVAAGTLAFAFAHVVFRNAIAIALTALGGLLFLHTYLVTGSMLVSSLEHAAYGVAVFTFGIGRSLYLGSARGDGGTGRLFSARRGGSGGTATDSPP